MMLALGPAGTRIPACRGTTASCPACGGPVVAKTGAIVAHHWAHRARADCDPWAERDTAWHREWQEAVPPERREVVIGAHRADIVAAGGEIIELQHSPISPAQIAEREQFYVQRAGAMVWLFDATDAYRAGRLSIRPHRGDYGRTYGTFRWKHARKSVGACRQPVLLDLGDGRLLLLQKIYFTGRCGGWGDVVTARIVRAWLSGTGLRAVA